MIDWFSIVTAIVVSASLFTLTSSLLAMKKKSTLNDTAVSNINSMARYRASQNIILYSNEVLDFVKSIITQTAVFKFRTFADTHQMDKITKLNVESIAREVAIESNNSININNIKFGLTGFTREFYDKFIIEFSIIATKKLLETYLNTDEEE